MNKRNIAKYEIRKAVCEVPSPYSYCKNQLKQDLVGYFLKGNENKKVRACETCYQETKKKQWEINWQRRWIEAKWFYFYDEARQKREDEQQLADYNHRKNCLCFKVFELQYNTELKKWIKNEINDTCNYCKKFLENKKTLTNHE